MGAQYESEKQLLNNNNKGTNSYSNANITCAAPDRQGIDPPSFRFLTTP